MIKFDATGGLKEPNRDQIKTINKVQAGNEELDNTKDGLKVSERQNATAKILKSIYHLKVTHNVPIAQKPRRVPYHLMDPMKKRMEEFVEKDIMEKVPDHESITWCSPPVVQPKPKNPSDIRFSLAYES